MKSKFKNSMAGAGAQQVQIEEKLHQIEMEMEQEPSSRYTSSETVLCQYDRFVWQLPFFNSTGYQLMGCKTI